MPEIYCLVFVETSRLFCITSFRSVSLHTHERGGGQGGGGLVTKIIFRFHESRKTKFHFHDFQKHRSVTKSETIQRFYRQQNLMLTKTHFTDFNIRAKGLWKSLRDITKHCERLTMVHEVYEEYEGIR